MGILVERLVSEQRRERELSLAYRIAATRMRSAPDARALGEAERTYAALAARLADLAGMCAPAECRRSWASIGALHEPTAVLRALAHLEHLCEGELLRARRAATVDVALALVLDEALAAHRSHRTWLEERVRDLQEAA